MRVLMVTERYFPIWGGAENQLRQLIPNLIALDCEVTVVTRRWREAFLKKENIGGVGVVRLGVPGTSLFATGCFIVSLCMYLVSNKNKFDVLHSHGAVNMGALCAVFSKLFGVHNVAKIASADRIPPLSRSFFGKIIISIFKKSSAIISMTDEIDEELATIKTPIGIIHRITNGVDGNRFKPAGNEEKKAWLAAHNMKQDTLVVLFSSRLVHGKGLDVLLGAWSEITDRFTSAFLVVVGSGINQHDSAEHLLKQQVATEGLKNVIFVGETKTPEYYLGVSDIFVFPSRREGFPNALMEAMASGSAIVASRIGGVQAVLQDSTAGLTFTPENSGELAKLLLLLIDNNELRLQKGMKSRNFVLAKYSFTKIAAQYMDLYRQLT